MGINKKVKAEGKTNSNVTSKRQDDTETAKQAMQRDCHTPETFFFASVVTALCGAVLHIAADIFQQYQPVFPFVPVVWCALALHTLVPVIIVAAGVCNIAGFAVFQLFRGGLNFVLLQTVGYFVWCLSLLVTSFYVLSLRAGTSATHYGVLSLSGCFSLFANVILLRSLNQFRADEDEPTAWLKKSPNAETILVVLLQCVQVLNCLVASAVFSAAHLCAVSFVVLHAISIHIVHGIIGRKHTPGYQLFMPFQGTIASILTASCGWASAVVSMYAAVALINGPAVSPQPRVFLLLMALGCGSVVCLLVHTRLMAPTKPAPPRTLLATYGCMLLTLVSALHATIVGVSCWQSDFTQPHSDSLLFGVLSTAYYGGPRRAGIPAVVSGDRYCCIWRFIQLLAALPGKLRFFAPPRAGMGRPRICGAFGNRGVDVE